MRRILRNIVAGEGDQLGDLSTLAEPGVVEAIKQKVAESSWVSLNYLQPEFLENIIVCTLSLCYYSGIQRTCAPTRG